jgi:hypothetical protein
MKLKTSIFFFILFIGTSRVSAQDCSDIKMETDKSTGKINLHSPLQFYLIYYKTITIDTTHNNDTTYMVRLSTSGSTLNLSQKGVIILLENGTKLEFPKAEVDFDNTEFIGTTLIYKYHSYISLSKSDIKKLSNSGISEYRLYIYEAQVRKKHLLKFKEFLNCLINN